MDEDRRGDVEIETLVLIDVRCFNSSPPLSLRLPALT